MPLIEEQYHVSLRAQPSTKVTVLRSYWASVCWEPRRKFTRMLTREPPPLLLILVTQWGNGQMQSSPFPCPPQLEPYILFYHVTNGKNED